MRKPTEEEVFIYGGAVLMLLLVLLLVGVGIWEVLS